MISLEVPEEFPLLWSQMQLRAGLLNQSNWLSAAYGCLMEEFTEQC
jgi:hypothetical protein